MHPAHPFSMASSFSSCPQLAHDVGSLLLLSATDVLIVWWAVWWGALYNGSELPALPFRKRAFLCRFYGSSKQKLRYPAASIPSFSTSPSSSYTSSTSLVLNLQFHAELIFANESTIRVTSLRGHRNERRVFISSELQLTSVHMAHFRGTLSTADVTAYN